jgi:pimeloyl-ACP methyl ester carboxylesterase
MTSIAAGDAIEQQVERINASGRVPVVFVHGLWLLASSWDRWADVFEEVGYAPLLPGWPDDPATVGEANEDPEALANKTVGQVADHYERIIGTLTTRPAVIGHSFGGLIVQMLAGRGISAATVAIDPAPFRGVLPLPRSPTPSTRTRRRTSTRPSRFRLRGRHCSKPRPPTSTRSRRSRSTAGPTRAGRCSSSRERGTTRSRGDWRTAPSSARRTTPA